MSNVEMLFYVIQKKLGGNLTWQQLSPEEQLFFTQACDCIIQMCGARNEKET
jgi:hypothetical protein